MAITRSEFEYLQASREGDEVAIGTWIVEWDEKLKMARRFQVIRICDGTTLLRARMRFACIELSSGRPRRLPPEFIAGYGPAVLSGGVPGQNTGPEN
jgi:acyl-CoA thioester hydrolase